MTLHIAFTAHFTLSSLNRNSTPDKQVSGPGAEGPLPYGSALLHLAGARGAHTTRCPFLQLMPCPPPPRLPSLGGERGVSVSDLQRPQNLPGVGPLVWWSLSQVLLLLCLSSGKGPRLLGEGRLALDTVVTRPFAIPCKGGAGPPDITRGHQLHPRGWSLPVQESKSTKSLL